MPKNNYTKTKESGRSKRNTRNTSKGKGTTKASTSRRHTGANNYVAGGIDSYDDIKSNDIGWYDKASYLFSEATRVPFDVISGAPYNYSGSHTGMDARKNTYSIRTGMPLQVTGEAIPGIMAIRYYPFIGYSDSVNSPINRAFTTMFGDLQSKTTGLLPFQQADLAMFVTSTSCIAGLIGHAKKIMEIADLYTPLNYYYPIDLMTAIMGDELDALEVIQNKDKFRAMLNNLIFQFNSLKIPSFVDSFKRQYSIAHNVYADEDDVQAQLYVFVPVGRYVYSDADSSIKMVSLGNLPDPTGQISFPELLHEIQDCLDKWRNSSDLPLINGALLRAYPDNEFVKIDMLEVGSKLVPVYDRNILWQINNSRSANVVMESLNVTQDVVNNFLVSKPELDVANNTDMYYRSWVYLNSYDYNQSPEFIMEATRLIPYIDFEMVYDTDGDKHVVMNTAVTEIIKEYALYYRIETADGNQLVKTTFETNVAKNDINIIMLSMLSKWRNAPRITMWDQTLEGEEYVNSYLGEFGDLANYTRLYQDQLASLHEAALQSLYWIDSMNLRV